VLNLLSALDGKILYQHAKFGEIKLRATTVGAKIGVFLCHAWSACAWGTLFKQVFCDGLWVDFDAIFSALYIMHYVKLGVIPRARAHGK